MHVEMRRRVAASALWLQEQPLRHDSKGKIRCAGRRMWPPWLLSELRGVSARCVCEVCLEGRVPMQWAGLFWPSAHWVGFPMSNNKGFCHLWSVTFSRALWRQSTVNGHSMTSSLGLPCPRADSTTGDTKRTIWLCQGSAYLERAPARWLPLSSRAVEPSWALQN